MMPFLCCSGRDGDSGADVTAMARVRSEKEGGEERSVMMGWEWVNRSSRRGLPMANGNYYHGRIQLAIATYF